MNAKVLFVFGIILSLALAVNWASPNSSEATTFRPVQGPVTFSSTATGANPDITTTFEVLATPAPASANFTGQFGGAITFSDAAVTQHTDAGMLDGSYVGQLTTTATLGLANGGCWSDTPVTFDFVEATTSDTVIIEPSGPSSNLLANLAEDDGDLDNDHQTFLTSAASAAATTLTVASSASFSPGEVVYIGGSGATTPETKTIATIPTSTTITLTAGLSGAHALNETVVVPDVPAFAFNGIPDGADAYPSFIRDSMDPDGPGGLSPIVPRARYFGTAFVANSLIVTLQFVVLNQSDGPGGAVDLTNIGSVSWASAAWGTPSVTFLNNPLAPPSNSAISDFCNFTSTTNLKGVAHDNSCTPVAGSPAPCTGTGAGFTLRLAQDGGCPGSTTTNECDGSVRVTNPGVDTVLKWRQWAVSFRDWDQGASPPQAGDGIETPLDPCPTHPVGRGSVDSWDPRSVLTPPEDSDGDGIPNTSTVGNLLSCDSTSSVGLDEDGDGWQNRLDNCPLLASGNHTTTLSAAAASGATTVSVTALSGALNPVGFVVGDVVSITQGLTSDVGLELTAVGASTITFAGDPLSQSYTAGANVVQNTHGPNSGQNDQDIPPGGLVRDAGPNNDGIGAPCDPNPTDINGHYHATVVLRHVCIGAAVSGCSDAIDSDGDGVSNLRDNCRGGANAAPAGFAQSQRDLNADGFSDIGDIVLAAGKFGTEGGNPAAVAGYEGRLDLNNDRFVDIGDIVLLAGVFGSTC